MYYLSVRYLKKEKKKEKRKKKKKKKKEEEKRCFHWTEIRASFVLSKQNKRCQFLTLVCFWSCIWYTDEWRFSAAADNCLETFENSMENNKRLLEEQDCPCDTEHMWSCPAGQQTVTSKGAGGQAALSKVMSELAQLHSAQGLSLVSYWLELKLRAHVTDLVDFDWLVQPVLATEEGHDVVESLLGTAAIALWREGKRLAWTDWLDCCSLSCDREVSTGIIKESFARYLTVPVHVCYLSSVLQLQQSRVLSE